MNYCLGEDTIHFSHIKSNILRCTITRKADIKNESWLIQRDVFGKLYDDTDPKRIGLKMEGDTAVFKLQDRQLLRLAKYSLTETGVVRYSTQGEEPRIEVVKTVDGQRTQIANLRPYIDRKAYTGSVAFSIPPDAGIFGLGQDEDGIYNRRGTKYYLYQQTCVPPCRL
jgi:alpha-D-xyloside xylohydrolase